MEKVVESFVETAADNSFWNRMSSMLYSELNPLQRKLYTANP